VLVDRLAIKPSIRNRLTDSLELALAQGNGDALLDVVDGEPIRFNEASLAYLKQLPIDKLKLDQGFVRDLPDDPNNAAIAKAVIAVGHSLQFKVVAEGVETEAQRCFLQAEGCDQAQGYLYSRPLPPEALAPFFAKFTSSPFDYA